MDRLENFIKRKIKLMWQPINFLFYLIDFWVDQKLYWKQRNISAANEEGAKLGCECFIVRRPLITVL